MPGRLRCDALPLGETAFLAAVPSLLSDIVSRSRRYRLEVRGQYYFSIPDGPITSEPGWYIICDANEEALYVGTTENLNGRLNTNVGSIDNFANSNRTSDPERNFVKALASTGILGSLSAVVIPESLFCGATRISGPLTKRDRENVEKCLSIFRVHVFRSASAQSRPSTDR